nr:MAG TPA: Histone-like Protein p6 [Caudoviricetes sp.]
MCYNNSCKEILQGGENMKITRSLTVNKINVICYDPENKCEITKELVIIGNLTDEQISKEIKKRNFGIVIDWERTSEETKLYGMDAEVFLKNAIIIKEKEN